MTVSDFFLFSEGKRVENKKINKIEFSFCCCFFFVRGDYIVGYILNDGKYQKVMFGRAY